MDSNGIIHYSYLVKNSFLAYFVSRTISTVIDHMQEHISSDFSFSLTALIPKVVHSLTALIPKVVQVSGYPD